MMIAVILATTLMMLCPSISAILAPGHALSPLVQHVQQCTYSLSTFVQFEGATLEHTSDVIHEPMAQPVSETSLIIYDATKTRANPETCPVSSIPSRTAIEIPLTIDGPVAIQPIQRVHNTSQTWPSSTNLIAPAGSSQSTAVVLLKINEQISTKAGGKGVNKPLPTHLALPTYAATAFNGHPPTNKTIMVADQQPDLLSSELEATLVSQGFHLASLINQSKSQMNLRESRI